MVEDNFQNHYDSLDDKGKKEWRGKADTFLYRGTGVKKPQEPLCNICNDGQKCNDVMSHGSKWNVKK